MARTADRPCPSRGFNELRHKDYLRDIPEDCDASFRGLLAGLLFSSAVWLLIIGLAAIARRLWPW